MKLQSFAMLLPCGVGIFSGVEFVCCPNPAANSRRSQTVDLSNKGNEIDKKHIAVNDDDADDEDADDDDYYDDDYDDDDDLNLKTSTTTTTTTTTTTERPVDVYLSHFDSQHEHEAFKTAQKSLEENHREKVTKVLARDFQMRCFLIHVNIADIFFIYFLGDERMERVRRTLSRDATERSQRCRGVQKENDCQIPENCRGFGRGGLS